MLKSEAEQIVLSHGWLSRQSKSYQAAILKRARLLKFMKGDHVYSAGDPSGGIYGTLQGGFGVDVTTDYSEPRLAHIGRRGMWFGTRPVNTQQPRIFTFRATEPSFALNVPMNALNELAAKDPSSARRIAELSEENMRLASHVVSDLLLRSSEERIAATLLRVSGVTVADPLPQPQIIHISQEELGVMANVSRDVTNRVLGEFEAQGLVELGHCRVQIVDPDALLEIAYRKS